MPCTLLLNYRITESTRFSYAIFEIAFSLDLENPFQHPSSTLPFNPKAVREISAFVTSSDFVKVISICVSYQKQVFRMSCRRVNV